MATVATPAKLHQVVSHPEWVQARKKFLDQEKELTRLRDELSRQRRELPWELVEKVYTFEGARGTETLADLFDGRSQLIVYHFMLGRGWAEGCKSCSYLADHFDAMTIHLAHRDVTFAVISHAPYAEIELFKERMGWKFHWVSSFGSDFNYDYGVSFTAEQRANGAATYNYEPVAQIPSEELPGASVFFKEESRAIYHTYSTYARGLDILVGTYNVLDLAPKGRDEEGLKHTMAWVRHHDKYEGGYFVDPKAGWEHPKVVTKPACCSTNE